MTERYERDEYSFGEYSDESINVGCVCSWSIADIAKHRPVVNVALADVTFNSDSNPTSVETLYRLADRLRQVETSDTMAHIARGKRAVRASLRDYEQEVLWDAMRLRPPRRIGERIELVPVPSDGCSLLKRTMT